VIVRQGIARQGNSYNDDDSNQEDRDCLERDIAEKWLKQHGRLYPVVSVEGVLSNLERKWNMRINYRRNLEMMEFKWSL
jgi:hypothetical protein